MSLKAVMLMWLLFLLIHSLHIMPIVIPLLKNGGIGPVSFTLAADMTHTICQSYGVEHPVAGVAFRGAFIIDKNGMVRSQIVNDLPIGRNIDELLRIIDAVQFFEENGEVCPAGWQKGKAGMKALLKVLQNIS